MGSLEFMKKCGYKDGFEPKELDMRIDDIMDFLIDTDLDDRQFHINHRLQHIINSTEAFFSKHFQAVHTVLTVPRNTSSLYKALNPTGNKAIEECPIEVIEASPFVIPVLLKNDHSFQASIRKQNYVEGQDIGLFSPIVITNISLAKPFTMYSYVSYTHEIMHSQIDSVKGAIENYHNLEVLSIFMEKLRAFELGPEIFHEVEKRRLFYLGCNLKNFYEGYDNTDYVYYESTLKAESLFDLYMNSCDEGKKIIMDYIDMIMAGELTLEQMLDYLGISLDNSLNISSMQRNLNL